MSNHVKKGTVIVDHVSKRYRLGTLGTLRGTVSALLSHLCNGRDTRHVLWALRDVGFRLEPGESLGVIGPNGAGKTTMLKLLSNITQPTIGQIVVQGRVSSLIELGAGFHPELTGRENIYLNGVILGLTRHEIRRKLDAIVAFSELERFIDTPVKRYSSGMYVRLGFAVAVHVEADILLVDEVLAVGDAAFRQKCLARMESLQKSGTTIIFVSHNMAQVQRLCQRALLLLRGRVHFLGETAKALSAYEKIVYAPVEGDASLEPQVVSDVVFISDVAILDGAGQPIDDCQHSQALTVRITYHASCPIVEPIVKVWLIRQDGIVCAMSASTYQPGNEWALAGEGTITVRFDPVQLVSGSYSAEVRIIDSADSMQLASGQGRWFQVHSPGFVHQMDRGIFVPNVQWSHIPAVIPTHIFQTKGVHKNGNPK
jgi:ABC-type polysaccharide/polyol phosphate transport system ATPase subunit